MLTQFQGFEYAEHGFLGDNIVLKLDNGQSSPASQLPFTLSSGLQVTYGQINGLAGDFYGTSRPISDGATFSDSCDRFRDAWATLALDRSRQPAEAQKILRVLQEEVNKINEALADHVEPSTVYATLPNQTATFMAITFSRPKNEPSYLGLARINWDHFGEDARTAYNAGHTLALQKALEGRTIQALLEAYAINAFADHFLQDSFAAGHTRTPRRSLHSKSGDADICAKVSMFLLTSH